MSRMVEFEGSQGLAPMNWTSVRVVFDVDHPLVMQEDPGNKERSLLAIGGWIYTVSIPLDQLHDRIEKVRGQSGPVQFTAMNGREPREPKGFKSL